MFLTTAEDIWEAIGLDEVQSHILGKEPLPSTREVFLDVRRDKNENIVMMGKNPMGVSTENSTLNTTTIETQNSVLNTTTIEAAAVVTNQKLQQKVEDKGNDWVICWKLHGKLANWKGYRFGDNMRQQMQAATRMQFSGPKNSPFSKEQLEHLYKLQHQA
ncbi:hypothetical protein AAG906_040756 [Vitis piasezkii]